MDKRVVISEREVMEYWAINFIKPTLKRLPTFSDKFFAEVWIIDDHAYDDHIIGMQYLRLWKENFFRKQGQIWELIDEILIYKPSDISEDGCLKKDGTLTLKIWVEMKKEEIND